MGEYPGPPDLTFGEEPYAEVERSSWCTWSVSIHHGILRWGPEGGAFTVLGTERMAERRAERLLEKYRRRYERNQEYLEDRFRID